MAGGRLVFIVSIFVKELDKVNQSSRGILLLERHSSQTERLSDFSKMF
jgi:hypothetical protein